MITTVCPDAVRCTNAVLDAFGVQVDAPVRDGGGLLEILSANGWGYRSVTDGQDERGYYRAEHTELFGAYGTKNPTLRKVCAAFPEGDFYVFTSGHALALRDGVLTDTEDRGPDGRRVLGLYRLTRSA